MQQFDKLDHPFANQEDDQTSVNILLVSDIHNDFKKLEKLKSWFFEKNKCRFHYIFALGDFDNIQHDQPDNSLENEYENISNILSFLEFGTVPILYIPGNHDAAGFLKESPSLTQHSKLVQNTSYKIANGLQVVGLGGSIPAFIDKNGKLEQIWKGFPYKSDSEFGHDLKKLAESHCKSDIQTILLTHIGPYLSSTTIDTSNNPGYVIYSGSKELQQLILENNSNILCDLHGHTHYGCGRANLLSTQIINPGSLHEGEFGILALEKNLINGIWSVKYTEFINLNSF